MNCHQFGITGKVKKSGVVIIYQYGLVTWVVNLLIVLGHFWHCLAVMIHFFTSYTPCYSTGASETVVLNMSTLAWSVVTSVQGRVPVASEVRYLYILARLHML